MGHNIYDKLFLEDCLIILTLILKNWLNFYYLFHINNKYLKTRLDKINNYF